MNEQLRRILPKVQKPARYVGGEYREIIKNPSEVSVRVAFCFPDTYEIGMSYLGMRILYDVMNRMPQVWCERVFAPWGDMEEQMHQANLPLWALESGDAVRDFDVIAFSVGYEMSYTNLLNMLLLAQVPLRAKDRKDLKNLVVAGGTCMYNPEPLAEFVDICSLGEGEEVTVELLQLYDRAKQAGWDKETFLLEAAQIEGLYVPAFYRPVYCADGTIDHFEIREGVPRVVQKRIVQDLDAAVFPTETIIPSTEIVHDRTTIELFRGCIRGCRFCQAGFVYRPVRERSANTLACQAMHALEDSGYPEITLSSLSTSDYRQLPELTEKLLDYCEPQGINLSLPSLRIDNFSKELMQRIQTVRKSSLTFAPEAGTQRLRDAINKNVTEDEILSTCETAFRGGWNSVKLYFMLGLPTETDEDVVGIAELAQKILHCWRTSATVKNRGVNITVSVAYFVPKPFTPMQWEPQISTEEYMRRVMLLKESIRSKSIQLHWHETELSRLEAVLARGDRRLCDVLEYAVRHGARLDGWREYFSLSTWDKAFEACGLDPAFYANRTRGDDEVFPWEPISVGVSRAFFARERKQIQKSVITPDCRVHCSGCGANCLLEGGVCDA